MLSEPATVVDASPDRLVLQSARRSSCSACSLKSGCGHHLLSPPAEHLELAPSALSGSEALQHLVPGARVQVQLEGAQLVRLSLFLYTLPLAGLLAATLLALWLDLAEGGSALLAALGLVAGLALARRVLQRRQDAFRIAVSARNPAEDPFP
jgi:sigma-E factor negative regulatory protein RseC